MFKILIDICKPNGLVINKFEMTAGENVTLKTIFEEIKSVSNGYNYFVTVKEDINKYED